MQLGDPVRPVKFMQRYKEFFTVVQPNKSYNRFYVVAFCVLRFFMSSLASKLLMCVCAGGTGAAIVPVSKAVRHQVAPRHATVKRVAAAPMAVAAAPCVPIVVGNALTPVGLDALSPMLALDSAPPMLTSAIGPQLETLGEVGDILAINGGIGSTSGGGGGGGIGGGGGAPGGGLPPVASNAPEPTSWALMIGGFGLLGGAMRYSRRHTTA